MAWVAVAIGGSALLGAGASLYSSSKQQKAAQQAAQLQQQTAQQAATQAQQATDNSLLLQREGLNFQREVNSQNQANIAPYLGVGYNALGRVNDVMAGAPGWDNFLKSPDYQFRFSEGMNALENSAAARGGLLSGNFLRGAQDYGQRAASQEFGSYFQRIMDTARLGQNSAVGAAALANQTAGQVGQTANAMGNTNLQGNLASSNYLTNGANTAGNYLTSAATAGASGVVGATNSLNSGINNYLFYNAMQSRPGSVYSGSTAMAPYGLAPGQFNPNVPGGFVGYGA